MLIPDIRITKNDKRAIELIINKLREWESSITPAGDIDFFQMDIDMLVEVLQDAGILAAPKN